MTSLEGEGQWFCYISTETCAQKSFKMWERAHKLSKISWRHLQITINMDYLNLTKNFDLEFVYEKE